MKKIVTLLVLISIFQVSSSQGIVYQQDKSRLVIPNGIMDSITILKDSTFINMSTINGFIINGVAYDIGAAPHVYVVGEGSSFPTIQSAVDVASDGDIIYILPGIYEETINVSGFTIVDTGTIYAWEWYTYATNPHPPKKLHFIGADRESCVVVNYTGDYATPPFFMMQGSLQNLTIKAIHKSGIDYSSIRKANYCIHYDGNNYDYYRNKTLLVKNCHLIADSQDNIGAGAMRSGCKIIVEDCVLEQLGNYRCFGCHNNPVRTDGDFTFEIELHKNIMMSGSLPCVGLSSYDLDNHCKMRLSACFNAMYSSTRGRDAFLISDVREVISLSPVNFGNSATNMNVE